MSLLRQQLLTIQEELNNKKSELEQAKEEQSHTQALLKVLQEQVRGGGGCDSGTISLPDTRIPLARRAPRRFGRPSALGSTSALHTSRQRVQRGILNLLSLLPRGGPPEPASDVRKSTPKDK